MQDRRLTCLSLAAIAAWLFVGPLQAQTGPPIHVVFPFAAGGTGDVLARLIAGKMQDSLNRGVIVEDRPDAAGRVAVTAVKAAAPDGSTLLLTPIAPMSVYPFVYTKLDYDPIKDFAAITQLGIFDFGIAVGPQVEAKTLVDLVAWAKANPAQAKYAIPAAGTLPHFLGGLFGREAAVNLQAVPYHGSAEALADVVAGNVPIVITPTSDLVQAYKSGRIRVLATSGRGRSPFLSDVPTLREAGYRLAATGWYGMFAPAKTPADVIERLNKAAVTAMRSRDVETQLLALGLQPTGTTAAEFANTVQDDTQVWGPAVKASGFPPQQ
jgi:tripartite-type tricarboxylate transporter receptor subunit TctC